MAGGSDTGFVHITSQMLGIGTISFMGNVEIASPVGPGVTVSVTRSLSRLQGAVAPWAHPIARLVSPTQFRFKKRPFVRGMPDEILDRGLG